jgi:translocation and assembly module TamA
MKHTISIFLICFLVCYPTQALRAQSKVETPVASAGANTAAATTAPVSVTKKSRVFVKIDGVDDKALRNVLLKAIELRAIRKKTDSTEAQIRRLYRRAPAQITTALEPFGYYQAKVVPSLSRKTEQYRAVFAVALGSRTVLESVDFKISGAAELDKTVAAAWRKTSLKPQAFLDHGQYETAKGEVQRALMGRGYLDAELVEHRIEIERAESKARVILKWESGERYAISGTQFTGAQFDPAFLQRYIAYEPGDLYTQKKLLELQQRLVDADYFSVVEVAPETDDAKDGSVPISVVLAPAKRSIYSYGLSFGTDSGAGVRGGLERRWVNDRGHKFRSAAEVSQRFKAAALSYEMPQPDRNRTNYAVNLSYRDETTDTSRSQVSKIGFARTREWKGWQQTYAIQGLQGDFIVGGEAGSTTLIYPEMLWYRREADDLVYPTEGYALTLNARAGSKALLSDASFASASAEGKYITSLNEQSRILARVSAGALYTNDFARMPPELRYFAGGDRSLRGFGYQELGPLNDAGKVRGGKYLAVISGEYERKLSDSWAAAVFTDVGNAFDRDSKVEIALGAGIRWRSPVGLVRLDFAAALDTPSDPFRVHLIIGPDL